MKLRRAFAARTAAVADGFYRENSSWQSPPLVPARTYRIAVPAALVEIVIGAGSLALTFLAGAEIDPVSLREHWRASLSIGLVSFALPFGAAFGFCGLVLGWSLHAAEIGGIALSTTSVAVVYAVMVETGLNRHDLGKLILAACFVTDLGTVLALGGLFASYGWLLIVFVAVTAVTVVVLPRMLRLAIRYFGGRVSEPEIKLLLVVLFGLGGLAAGAGQRSRDHRAPAAGQAGRQAGRRLADGGGLQAGAPRPCLHHVADGHRAHLRLDRRAVRPDPPSHRPPPGK